MNYATAAEVKAYSALSEVAAKSDDDLNNKYIPRAQRLIDSYCRQNFHRSALKVIAVDGNGSNRLELPERLISLSQLRFIDPGAHAAQSNGLSNIDFITASHYSISDDTKVEISGGKVQLINDPGVEKTWPFTTPANYTYDTDKIEVTGGLARLKNRRPANATFHANFETDENGNWGDGVLAGTLRGTATVHDGILDCTGNVNKGCSFPVAANADFLQTGCVRLRVKPKYSGAPPSDYSYFAIYASGNNNLIHLAHRSDGNLMAYVYNSGGGLIGNPYANWSPVADTEYEIEVNIDITAGASRLFVNGSQLGGTHAGTGTRTTPNGFAIGVNRVLAGNNDVEILEVTAFDAVQHTGNYTPGASIPATDYATDNPTIEVNDGQAFTRLLDVLTAVITATGSDAIQAIMSSDGGSTYEYWTGSAWATSDGTYAQSNPIATLQTNLSTLASSGTFKIKFFLHSDDGFSRPSIDEATVSQDANMYPTDDDLYVDTTDDSEVDPDNFLSWVSFVLTYVLPTGADIRVLLSVDGRITWVGWNGSIWTTVSGNTTRTNATSITDLADHFAELDARAPINVRFFVYTSDSTVAPEVSNAAIGSLTLSANATVSSIDVDQVFNKNWYLMLDSEPVRARQRIGKQERLEDTLIFPMGFENIEITGYFGFSSVPLQVREALAEVVERIVLRESDKGVKHGGYKKEKIGDYEYERFTDSDKGMRDTYISNVAKDLLREYRKPILMSRI